MPFDGFGLGGALEKENLGTIVRWCAEELPENKPRHLLGISEPDDIFVGIENGVDTFDCVSPTRVASNAAVYTPHGRGNLTNARYKTDFTPIFEGCDCYTCTHYTKAYIHHLFKADERLSATLASILHPLVQTTLAAQIAQAEHAGAKVVVLDIPLLVESAYWRAQVDAILVVDCSEATQITRVMQRSQLDESAVRSIIASQATREARRAVADWIIVNDGITLEQLRAQVLSISQKLPL